MDKTQTLFVRIAPKAGAERFFRCGEEFTPAWRRLDSVDVATANRLYGEQMLEVSETQPDDYVPDAAEQAAAEKAAADQAAAEKAAADQAAAEKTTAKKK